MAAAGAAMLLVGCTPNEVPCGTDPMPTPEPFGAHHLAGRNRAGWTESY